MMGRKLIYGVPAGIVIIGALWLVFGRANAGSSSTVPLTSTVTDSAVDVGSGVAVGGA